MKIVGFEANNGVRLGVVFQQRHESIHLEARRMVQAGEIGEVVLARAQLALRLMQAGLQRRLLALQCTLFATQFADLFLQLRELLLQFGNLVTE